MAGGDHCIRDRDGFCMLADWCAPKASPDCGIKTAEAAQALYERMVDHYGAQGRKAREAKQRP